MLAERRQRVIYSNPRGLLWANDKQKFGQRMLESMGWREGEGLGLTKSGNKDSIKASMKFDSKGLGFKPTAASSWIEDNNAYEKILTDLAKHHTDTVQAVQSVQKAKKSKKGDSKRLQHFKKTIKAKNLDGKSERDIRDIFPTRKCSEEEEEEEEQIEETREVPLDEGKTISSSLSINDYFQQKMKSKLISTEADEQCEKPAKKKRKKNK